MFETSLIEAVGRFTGVVVGLPDAGLDRAWAWGAYDAEGIRFACFRTFEELRELAVRLAAIRAGTGPALTSAQRILAQYHAAHRDLQAALLGLEPEFEDRAPAEGEWPVRRTAAHIAGAEVGFYVVVRYALDQHHQGVDEPAAVPDEAWETLLGQDIASLEAILEGSLAGIQSYRAAFHHRILREFAAIGDEALDLPSNYWEGYPLSIRFRLHRFESHLRQHIVQVDKTLDALGSAPSEVMRLLRLHYAALAEVEGAAIGAWDIGANQIRLVADSIEARAAEIAGILSTG